MHSFAAAAALVACGQMTAAALVACGQITAAALVVVVRGRMTAAAEALVVDDCSSSSGIGGG
jgi:hypothetical protein